MIGVFGSATDVALFSGAVSKLPGFKALPLAQPQEATPKTVRIQPSPDGDDEGGSVQGSELFFSRRESSFTMSPPVEGMHTGNIQELTSQSKAGLGMSPHQSEQASVPKHPDVPD